MVSLESPINRQIWSHCKQASTTNASTDRLETNEATCGQSYKVHTIVIYEPKVVNISNYNSRIVIYGRKSLIRLATGYIDKDTY